MLAITKLFALILKKLRYNILMVKLVYIIIANLIISLASLVGVFTLSIKEKKLDKILHLFISLSAGVMMGGAFLHLLPEAQEKISNTTDIYLILLFAFVFFFLIERFLFWRHCHVHGKCEVHNTFGYMNLVGDGFHNFIDGVVIAGSFMTDIRLGIVTSLAVILHEIPQEIGDFGVLLYSGFSKKKALMANFLVATIAVLGGIVGYFLSLKIANFISYLLPFTAGGFLYISACDLIPEIRKETNMQKSLTAFGVFLIGILIMYLSKFLLHE